MAHQIQSKRGAVIACASLLKSGGARKVLPNECQAVSECTMESLNELCAALRWKLVLHIHNLYLSTYTTRVILAHCYDCETDRKGGFMPAHSQCPSTLRIED